MIGPARLAWRHARHHRGRTAIVLLCVAAAVALPLGVRVLVAEFRDELTQRAERTPMVVGAKGNRFDLTLALLYFRSADVDTISMADAARLRDARPGVVIPMNLRFTARTRPIVATTPEYAELRNLRPRVGTLPLALGEATLGHAAARDMGLSVGDHLFSDQRELFDIAKPQALKMRVVGVLQPTEGPDDDAVFVDLKTAWILEGLSHAHIDPAQAPERLVLDKTSAGPVLSEELIDFNEVTPQNINAFHLHAGEDRLPITGVIVVPESDRSGTILASQLNAGPRMQAVAPPDVVADLLAYVLRLRSILDGVSLLVAVLSASLFALVFALAVRVRAREFETYRRIGVARPTVAAIVIWEIAMILAAGVSLGVLAALALRGVGPELVKLL